MDFGTNKTPIDVIKEGSFGGTYFKNLMINFMKIVGKNLKN